MCNMPCDACQSVSCVGHRAGFGAYGLAPLAVAAIKFAPLAVSLIKGLGRLIGIQPRGNFQKFARTLYPFMRTAAAQAGLPVYCMWFGDWVGVNPDGSYGVAIGKEITASGYYPGRAEEETYQNGANPFYRTVCERSDGDCVNHPEDGYFELYDPLGVTQGLPPDIGGDSGQSAGSTVVQPADLGSQVSTQSVFDLSTLLWVGVAGIAAYAIWGRKK